ncbi:MAG: hypothetical protein J7K29_03355 [Candidatus Cloacimonetes bacterium]|nr:hypothetical protein [Candidatus Cloacimonadota bacterium]
MRRTFMLILITVVLSICAFSFPKIIYQTKSISNLSSKVSLGFGKGNMTGYANNIFTVKSPRNPAAGTIPAGFQNDHFAERSFSLGIVVCGLIEIAEELSETVISNSGQTGFLSGIFNLFRNRKAVSRIFIRAKFGALGKIAGISFSLTAMAGIINRQSVDKILLDFCASLAWLSEDFFSSTLIGFGIRNGIFPKNTCLKAFPPIVKGIATLGVATSVAVTLLTAESISDVLTNPGFYFDIGSAILPIFIPLLAEGPAGILLIGSSVAYNIFDSILTAFRKSKAIELYETKLLEQKRRMALDSFAFSGKLINSY